MARELTGSFDYYFQGEMLFRLGHARFLKARAPLSQHIHPHMIEFVYLARGTQNYQASGKTYTVHQGEVFYSLPDELHDTGSLPEEKSEIFFLIVDPEVIKKLSVFCTEEEYLGLKKYTVEQEKRVFQAPEELPGALVRLLRCFAFKDQHFDTRVRNVLSEVLLALCQPCKSQELIPGQMIQKSLAYIREHPEEAVKITDLCEMENMSASTYYKYFMQEFGVSPAEYILRQKIEKSKEMLQRTDLSVTEIAYQYKFSSSQYFATVFKRFCNMTPTEYREKAKKEGAG